MHLTSIPCGPSRSSFFWLPSIYLCSYFYLEISTCLAFLTSLVNSYSSYTARFQNPVI